MAVWLIHFRIDAECSDFYMSRKRCGMTCSMGRKGTCWSSAPLESLFNGLKNECVFHEDCEARVEAR